MFDPSVLDAIQQHALACYPEESCGIITAAGYEPQPNLHPEPTKAFRMPPSVDERIAIGDVLAVVHSHPDGPNEPSVYDQEQQIAMDIPWGICVTYGISAETPYFWGPGIKTPIMPRDFRWGPAGTDNKGDCLALLRDWYIENRGVDIGQYARDRHWLDSNPTRYVDCAVAVGFKPIPMDELRHGDMVLFAIQSQGKPNHAGIYLDGGYILHHLEGRMARRESFLFWRQGAVMFLRLPEDS